MTGWVPFLVWGIVGYVVAVKWLVTGPQRDPAGYILVAIVAAIVGGLVTRAIARAAAARRKSGTRHDPWA